MSRIAVLDTETTGFPSNSLASVIDVGGVIIDLSDGSEVSRFDSLVCPLAWGEWAEPATAIHRLTHDDVKGSPRPHSVTPALVAWLEKHDCWWWTSYNVAFDQPMLRRMGFVTGRLASCVMVRAMQIMGPAGVLRAADPSHPRYREDSPWLFPPLAPNPKSGTSACEFFGVDPILPAHRALSDARTAAEVMLRIKSYAPP